MIVEPLGAFAELAGMFLSFYLIFRVGRYIYRKIKTPSAFSSPAPEKEEEK